jgi:hypothetical protein
MIAFLVGMIGLWLQLTFNFGVPFPFNIILMPVTNTTLRVAPYAYMTTLTHPINDHALFKVRILEWWLKYYVASEIFLQDFDDETAMAHLEQLKADLG